MNSYPNITSLAFGTRYVAPIGCGAIFVPFLFVEMPPRPEEKFDAARRDTGMEAVEYVLAAGHTNFFSFAIHSETISVPFVPIPKTSESSSTAL